MKQVIFMATFILSLNSLGFAQGEFEARIQKERIAFFDKELQLTDSESKQFWPLYDQYREDEVKLKKSYDRDKKVALMSDQEVETYIFNSFELQEKEIALRRQYFEKLRTFMPIRKIAMLNRTEQLFKKRLLQHIKQQRQNRRSGERMQPGNDE